MWKQFLLALQFLTRLPVPRLRDVVDRDYGHSVLFYPVVGLVIGVVLAAIAGLLQALDVAMAAALVLGAWVLITGGLHLDGLADSADAWIGGHGDHDKTLRIMKDPYAGPMAVVALVVVLLIKFAALESLLATGEYLILALIPVLGRAVVPALFLTTHYVRSHGLGTPLAEHLPRRPAVWVLAGTAVIMLVVAGMAGLWLAVASAGAFALVRAAMVRRIGGTTGDTAGALVELTETAALIAAAFLVADAQ